MVLITHVSIVTDGTDVTDVTKSSPVPAAVSDVPSPRYCGIWSSHASLCFLSHGLMVPGTILLAAVLPELLSYRDIKTQRYNKTRHIVTLCRISCIKRVLKYIVITVT